MGFIAGIVVYFHGLGGNAGVGFTLYGKDIDEGLLQSARFVGAGVTILVWAIVARCLSLILDVARAWRSAAAGPRSISKSPPRRA